VAYGAGPENRLGIASLVSSTLTSSAHDHGTVVQSVRAPA
jgi:hypothetical protein